MVVQQNRSLDTVKFVRPITLLYFTEKELSSPQVDQYFAKYLTNQKLLDLQFSDANFRRYVLLQILILAQYLTSNIKFKQ